MADFHSRNKEVLKKYDYCVSIDLVIKIIKGDVVWHQDESGNVIFEDNSTLTPEEVYECTNCILREQKLRNIRKLRDKLLADTDFYVQTIDYPISDEKRREIIAYRQTLRYLPDGLYDIDIDENRPELYMPQKPI